MRHLTALPLLLVAACQATLPPAVPAPGHGLERVWIETLGLE
jgi:hypothetical protein